MLVLSRKPGESIHIGDTIRVTIVRIGPNNVRVGVDAPRALPIVREELVGRPGNQNNGQLHAAIAAEAVADVRLPETDSVFRHV